VSVSSADVRARIVTSTFLIYLRDMMIQMSDVAWVKWEGAEYWRRQLRGYVLRVEWPLPPNNDPKSLQQSSDWFIARVGRHCSLIVTNTAIGLVVLVYRISVLGVDFHST
jgi:hypothetical protein